MACMEQKEKSWQELREILLRDREEHREQMTQIMQVIMRLSRDKEVANDVGSVNTATRGY